MFHCTLHVALDRPEGFEDEKSQEANVHLAWAFLEPLLLDQFMDRNEKCHTLAKFFKAFGTREDSLAKHLCSELDGLSKKDESFTTLTQNLDFDALLLSGLGKKIMLVMEHLEKLSKNPGPNPAGLVELVEKQIFE